MVHRLYLVIYDCWRCDEGRAERGHAMFQNFFGHQSHAPSDVITGMGEVDAISTYEYSHVQRDLYLNFFPRFVWIHPLWFLQKRAIIKMKWSRSPTPKPIVTGTKAKCTKMYEWDLTNSYEFANL